MTDLDKDQYNFRRFQSKEQAQEFLEFLLQAAPELEPEMELYPHLWTTHRVVYYGRPMLPRDGLQPRPHERHWKRPEYRYGYGRYLTIKTDFERCCAQIPVFPRKGAGYRQCSRKAVADPDYTGEPTRCRQHSRKLGTG